MKTLLLSFKDIYFKPVYYGLKKYEYRKRFCDEESNCYLYLSGKTKKIIGILYLGRPIKLQEKIDSIEKYPDTFMRVKDYINNYNIVNALPIIKFIPLKTFVSLDALRQKFPGFMPPQLYFDLDNNLPLKNYLVSLETQNEIFHHKHDTIYFDNLAVSVKDMEKTKEYEDLDKKYRANLEKLIGGK